MAVPKDNTFILAAKDTADSISQEKPLAIGSRIWEYDPNKNAGLSWFMSNGMVDPCDQRSFGHLETTPFPNWIEYAGADEAAQAVTGLVFQGGAGELCQLGSRVFFPDINEIIYFNADFASTTTSGTCVRNFGRGVAATSLLLAGMRGHILPPAHIEGFTTGHGYSGQGIYKSFEMQEVSWPVEVTYPERAERSRMGDPFLRALRHSWKQSKDQREASLFFSGKKLDESSYTHPAGASEGLENYVTTHVVSTNKLSRMDFFDLLTEWQSNNPYGGAILCSLQFKSLVTSWAMEMSTINIPTSVGIGEDRFGFSYDKVKWIVGTYDLVDVHLLGQDESLWGKVFFCPYNHYAYRPLVGNQNLDISYVPINRDEVHSHEGEIYGVYGDEFFEEETWMRLTDLEF